MNWFKRRLMRWVDSNVGEAIKTEVKTALELKEIQHQRAQNKTRIEHYRSKIEFQSKLERENKQLLNDQESRHKKEVQEIVDKYESRVKEYKERIKVMRQNVEYAQSLCESVFPEKLAIQNICLVLKERTEAIMQNEKEKLTFAMSRNAINVQEISACLENAERINTRLDKQKDRIDKLIGLKLEEIE